jgi:hypothetical protein
VNLDEDVAKAVERLRREKGIGLSEAVNELIRGALGRKTGRRRFRQRTQAVGIRIDVSNVAEALDLLEGPSAR